MARREQAGRVGLGNAVAVAWLAAVPLFLGGVYLSAKTGVALADRQVPPGSLAAPGVVAADTEWRIAEPGLAVGDELRAVRAFDFARAGSRGVVPSGVVLLGDESAGWELRVGTGGDRRYLRIKFLSGKREDDEAWVIAAQLVELAAPVPAEVPDTEAENVQNGGG